MLGHTSTSPKMADSTSHAVGDQQMTAASHHTARPRTRSALSATLFRLVAVTGWILHDPKRNLIGTLTALRAPKTPEIRGFSAIGAPGFEPGTSPTRTARATRLRHAPTQTAVSHTARASHITYVGQARSRSL